MLPPSGPHDKRSSIRPRGALGLRSPAALATSRRSDDPYTDHMAKQVTATEAKAKILRLLDDAAAGEEIEITKRGRAVARLVPVAGARSLRGLFEGAAMTAVDDEEKLFSTGASWNAS